MAAGAAALAGCGPVRTVSVDRFGATGELVAMSGGGAGASYACFTCHGLRGEGDGGFTPRLAGLGEGYVERQLIAFSDGRRVDPRMAYVAGHLDARERKAVAVYYAAMPPRPTVRTPAESSAAAELYHAGDPARGLPACAACHGDEGEGMGRAYPPLAGHPPGYLAAQLEQWRHAKRRNDAGDAMLRISQLLTPSESAALAAYAATLPGGPPSPEFPAASLAARPGGPRSDASGPPLHVPESARAAAR
jgi:cytochrome c553